MLHRIHARIELTDAGIDLLSTAEQCLAALDKGFRRLEQYKKPNQLIVHTAADFAAGWLVSRPAQFRQHCPRVDIWLYTTEGAPDLGGAEIHCAIVRGDGDWPGFEAVRLLDDAQVPLCAPDLPLLAKAGRTARDLLDHQLLHDEDEVTWGDWFREAGFSAADPVEGPNFTSQSLMLQAVELGQGIALGSVVTAADRLAAGRLVAALPPALPDSRGYYLLRREDNLRSEHFKPFRAWLTATSASQPAVDEFTGNGTASPPPGA
ncbi:MAG: LysR substrate-binding domain-containing protein [Gammaproteobacteria bacterium]